ncbi:MAG: hypothetical protein AAF750_06610 [Planctomycetota bacterium]
MPNPETPKHDVPHHLLYSRVMEALHDDPRVSMGSECEFLLQLTGTCFLASQRDGFDPLSADDLLAGMLNAIRASDIDLTDCQDRSDVAAKLLAYLNMGKRAITGQAGGAKS